MLDDTYFMKQAVLEAIKAKEEGEIPVGAIIEFEGRIIARSHNLTETLCDVTAHAEIQAITAAATVLGGKYLIGCTLYVTLEPCSMCAAALGWAQISRIVYGAKDEKRGYSTVSEKLLHPKTRVTGGILADEASQMLKSFFSDKRLFH
jgi:tRNA(adenine34) deaminase